MMRKALFTLILLMLSTIALTVVAGAAEAELTIPDNMSNATVEIFDKSTTTPTIIIRTTETSGVILTLTSPVATTTNASYGSSEATALYMSLSGATVTATTTAFQIAFNSQSYGVTSYVAYLSMKGQSSSYTVTKTYKIKLVVSPSLTIAGETDTSKTMWSSGVDSQFNSLKTANNQTKYFNVGKSDVSTPSETLLLRKGSESAQLIVNINRTPAGAALASYAGGVSKNPVDGKISLLSTAIRGGKSVECQNVKITAATTGYFVITFDTKETYEETEFTFTLGLGTTSSPATAYVASGANTTVKLKIAVVEDGLLDAIGVKTLAFPEGYEADPDDDTELNRIKLVITGLIKDADKTLLAATGTDKIVPRLVAAPTDKQTDPKLAIEVEQDSSDDTVFYFTFPTDTVFSCDYILDFDVPAANQSDYCSLSEAIKNAKTAGSSTTAVSFTVTVSCRPVPKFAEIDFVLERLILDKDGYEDENGDSVDLDDDDYPVSSSTKFYYTTNGTSYKTAKILEDKDEGYFYIDLSKVFTTKEISLKLAYARIGSEAFMPYDLGEIAARPKLPSKLTLTYDLAGSTFEMPLWSILANGAAPTEAYEYALVPTTKGATPVYDDLDILGVEYCYVLANDVPSDTATSPKLGNLYNASYPKLKAQAYYVRLAADPNTSTPASKTKKLTPKKQDAPPKMKIDFKKEIIKLKAGQKYYFDAETTPTEKLVEKGGEETKPGLDASTLIDTPSNPLVIYTAATAKAPPSAPQKFGSDADCIALPTRSAAPTSGVALDKNKAKTTDKRLQFYDEVKNKWGSLPKMQAIDGNVVEVLVRYKPTAKFSGNVHVGNAAGLESKVKVTYGIIDPEAKKPKVGVVKVEFISA